ncbi:MAG: hypothetical protein KJ592_04155 [Nanoarchaeota archaeon]|nr:hypothetical protein [Nanoarchaeota archaeon]
MDNKGQFFALGLVLITLFLCFLVVFLYSIQQANAESSLVSPTGVFEMRDDLEIFEAKEMALAKELAESIVGDFASEEFLKEFDEKFLDGVMADESMLDFIFSGLVFNGRDFEDDGRREARKFLDEQLYSDAVEEDGVLILVRNRMGKRTELKASDKSKIDFRVGFVFEFDKRYVITEVAS